jgi:hypothetical protein
MVAVFWGQERDPDSDGLYPHYRKFHCKTCLRSAVSSAIPHRRRPA